MSIPWTKEQMMKANERLLKKVERYEKAISIIANETTCDDTWDFANRVLEGKGKTDLPYRISED